MKKGNVKSNGIAYWLIVRAWEHTLGIQPIMGDIQHAVLIQPGIAFPISDVASEYASGKGAARGESALAEEEMRFILEILHENDGVGRTQL